MKRFLALFTIILFLVPFAAAYGVTFYNPTRNPQDGKIFDKLEPDKAYIFEVKADDIAITKITFVLNREASNGGVTVYNLKSVPDLLPETPENTSYEVNELKYAGFVPHDTKKFMYEFKVSKAWLEEQSVPRNSITLHTYDRVLEQWTVLSTEIISDDDEFVYFTAGDDAGVHYLLIGKALDGTEATDLVPEEPVTPVEPESKSVSDVTDVDMTADVETVQIDTSTPALSSVNTAPKPAPIQPPVEPESVKSKESGFSLTLLFIAIAIIIVILYVVFGRKKLGGSSVDRELHNYIKESVGRGKSKKEVRDRLLEVGWHPQRVDKALAKHKEPEKPVEMESHASSIAEAKALADKQRKALQPAKKKPSKPKAKKAAKKK